ncbi:hypothetical protein LY625_02370 [Lysobacter sp. GX 14042]|uniref:hypothetical protein n=1 Tax=Lysobacter sp. GX 14042 TaxID=2907155 RepID=UPI001F2435C0|nr:hypothetical protein [Lysobacter sp. GX 14042]MCE7031479.1 hypothetical protein [Lysobacter sp. GX 14042]
MTDTRPATPRRFLVFFLFALTGSVAGVLAGPRIVAAFQGTPAWLLPAVLCVSVLFALLAAYLAFRLASGRATQRNRY